jgi:hypothetical protein
MSKDGGGESPSGFQIFIFAVLVMIFWVIPEAIRKIFKKLRRKSWA